MRVLVTGATGLIGGAVARKLKAHGYEVSGLARSQASAKKLTDQGFVAVYGDLADPASIALAARGSDAIVQAASPNDQQSAALDETSTRAILDALRGTGKRFLYTSGSLVYGATGDTTATGGVSAQSARLRALAAGIGKGDPRCNGGGCPRHRASTYLGLRKPRRSRDDDGGSGS